MASFASGYATDVAKLTKNSKIGFKTGLESSLKNITAQEGCFYLTSDSFRLYIGTNEGTLAPINQGVITMQTTDEITSLAKEDVVKGAFYYSLGDNILCVHNGQGWVQINSDTTIEAVGATVSTSGQGVQVTQTINESNKASHTSNFKIVGGDNVTVAAESGNVKISAHDAEYAIGTPVLSGTDVQVSLTKDGSTVANPLTFAQGDNINFDIDADGKIKINAIQTSVNNGLIKGADLVADTEGFKLTLTKNDNSTIVSSVNPSITYGEKATSSATFKNGVLNLDVLTSDEVEDLLETKIQGFNALTYKGAMAESTDSLPTSGVSIGDVYLQAFNGVMQGSGDGQSYEAGTLWIAQGNETNGVITSNLTWVCVENFSTDTNYTFSNGINGNKWTHTVTSKAGNQTNTAESYTVAGDKWIKIDGSGEAITISHEQHTVETNGQDDELASTKVLYESQIVEGATYDSAGHLLTVTSKKMAIPGVNAHATVSASGATVTNAVQTKSATGTGFNGTASSTTTTYTSSTLSVSAAAASNTAATVTLDLVWGEF